MDTLPHKLSSHSDESDDSALNQLYIAYGRKVKELLSQSDAETWIEDLWDMYTGYTAFSQECGFDHEGMKDSFRLKSWCFSFRMSER